MRWANYGGTSSEPNTGQKAKPARQRTASRRLSGLTECAFERSFFGTVAWRLFNLDFYASILCASFRRFVVCNRLGFAETLAGNSIAADPFFDGIILNGVGASLRQRLIISLGSDVIRMTRKIHPRLFILVHKSNQPIENRRRFRFEVASVEIK